VGTRQDKEDPHCYSKGGAIVAGKLLDSLGIELLLFVQNLEFIANVHCTVSDPCLDVGFWFKDKFFFCESEDLVLSWLWEVVICCKDTIDVNHIFGGSSAVTIVWSALCTFQISRTYVHTFCNV